MFNYEPDRCQESCVVVCFPKWLHIYSGIYILHEQLPVYSSNGCCWFVITYNISTLLCVYVTYLLANILSSLVVALLKRALKKIDVKSSKALFIKAVECTS